MRGATRGTTRAVAKSRDDLPRPGNAGPAGWRAAHVRRSWPRRRGSGGADAQPPGWSKPRSRFGATSLRLRHSQQEQGRPWVEATLPTARGDGASGAAPCSHSAMIRRARAFIRISSCLRRARIACIPSRRYRDHSRSPTRCQMPPSAPDAPLRTSGRAKAPPAAPWSSRSARACPDPCRRSAGPPPPHRPKAPPPIPPCPDREYMSSACRCRRRP